MKPIRIGFLGNQNNYPFVLARALRQIGHDVRVVIDQPDRLDRPEHRYADIATAYPDWIVEIPEVRPVDVAFATSRWQHALDAVRDCDALVLNRLGFGAAAALRIPALCLTTGADLEHWSNPDGASSFGRHSVRRERPRDWVASAMQLRECDRESVTELMDRVPAPVHRAWQTLAFRRMAAIQQRGLRRAVAISAFPDEVSPLTARMMESCLSPDAERLCLLMADVSWILPTALPENKVLRIFNSARILWQEPFPAGIGAWEHKGTDVLLRGIAAWHHRTQVPLDVRLVEKGPSVAASKSLIEQLRIAHLVSWQRELSQAAVFEEYSRADIVSEQCGRHVLGMAGYEAMAAGRPVLANGRPEVFSPIFGAAPPVAQARTPEEVAAQLDRLAVRAERERLARTGRAFVEQHLSPVSAACAVAGVLTRAVDTRREWKTA